MEGRRYGLCWAVVRGGSGIEIPLPNCDITSVNVLFRSNFFTFFSICFLSASFLFYLLIYLLSFFSAYIIVFNVLPFYLHYCL